MVDAPNRKARRHWFGLTPDRFVLLLLVLEGFLLLSERFQWFAFNRHKGWTVLIAVESVALAMLLMFLWFLAAMLFRLRFQFSIRSLLLLTLVVATACSWLAVERQQARKVMEGLHKLHGMVYYDYELGPSGDALPGTTPPGQPWLRKLLGNDLFLNVVQVSFHNNREFGDAGLEHLKRLTQLQKLDLDGTNVSDAGLVHLKGLTQLKWLLLNGTRVSDAGLEHLKALTQLRLLDLRGTTVSDTGLEHLKALTQLQLLGLDGPNVSAAGVRELRKALPRLTIQR